MKPDSDIPDSMHGGAEARKNWMGILARTATERLERAFADLTPPPEFELLRPPEIGMVMVRARAEAVGDRFNLGEMTMSRCSVRLSDGPVGHGYVAGRDKRHAELAAVFDALMQTEQYGPDLRSTIGALSAELNERREKRAAKTAATRVNFFTMVRGED